MRDKNGRFLKGHTFGMQTRFKKGIPLSESIKAKMKGRMPWNQGKGCSVSIDVGNDIKEAVQAITNDKRSKGHIDKQGYRRYKIKGKTYKEHRLVWVFHNGPIPEGYDVHHKDGNKLNNKINNLEVIKHDQHSKRTIGRLKGTA